MAVFVCNCVKITHIFFLSKIDRNPPFPPSKKKNHFQKQVPLRKPINLIDGACQSLQLCRRCIEVDVEENNEQCNTPTERAYVSPGMRSFNTPGEIQFACRERNTDECGFRECCCEVAFSQKLINLFFDGIIFDTEGRHDGGFIWADECPIVREPAKIGCCGNYPDRAPFNREKRGCCRNKPFDLSKEKCCADGTIDAFC